MKDSISVAKATKMLGGSQSEVHALLASGQLQSVRMGNGVRILRVSVLNLLEERDSDHHGLHYRHEADDDHCLIFTVPAGDCTHCPICHDAEAVVTTHSSPDIRLFCEECARKEMIRASVLSQLLVEVQERDGLFRDIDGWLGLSGVPTDARVAPSPDAGLVDGDGRQWSLASTEDDVLCSHCSESRRADFIGVRENGNESRCCRSCAMKVPNFMGVLRLNLLDAQLQKEKEAAWASYDDRGFMVMPQEWEVPLT